MKVAKDFLIDRGFLAIEFGYVPSKSEPGVFHKVGYFKDGRMECDCAAFNFNKNKVCRHIQHLLDLKKFYGKDF